MKKSEIVENKLRSPKQVEDQIKRLVKQGYLEKAQIDAFYRLIEKPQGALKMVPVSDDRPAAKPATVEEMFPTNGTS